MIAASPAARSCRHCWFPRAPGAGPTAARRLCHQPAAVVCFVGFLPVAPRLSGATPCASSEQRTLEDDRAARRRYGPVNDTKW